MLVEGAGTAQPHQRAAAHLYLNIAAHQRLGDAVFIGVAQTDITQMPRFYSRFFGVQRQAGRAAGTLQLAATNFVIGSVIADGFQRAALIGNAEPRQAIIFQRFTAHRVTIQHQLHAGGAGVDLHVGLALLAAGPAPAGHGIRHLPRTGAVAVSGMVDRTDGDIGAVVGLQRHAGIEGFAQRLAGQVDAPRTRRHPARTAVEGFGVVGVLPRADHDFAKVVHARPDKVAHQAGFLFGQLAEFISIVAEGLAAQNQPLRVLFQVVLIAVDAVVVTRNVHVGKGVTGLDVAAVQGRAALHELIAQQPRQIVEELTADCLFLGGLLAALLGFFGTLGFFFCLFVAVHAEADGA